MDRREFLGGILGAGAIAVPQKPARTDRLRSTLDILLPDEPHNAAYPDDPIDFMRDVLGIDPWEGQEEITRAVWGNRYTSVASCHGIGKSFITAAIAITYLHLHENSIVLSTAPTGRQVEHVLWRNIRTLFAKSKKPLLGKTPLTTRYDISTDWYAMGFKPSDSETDPTQGFHAENVLVIIDEAAGVPTMLIDGLQAALTTEGSRMLWVGNPTSTSGPFYDSHHSKSQGFKTLVYAWEDTPNFKAGRTVRKGLITQKWVDEVIEKYGVESAYYRSRVLAEWVSPEDVLIPLHQLQAARERDWTDLLNYGDYPKYAGLDVARDGADKSVLTLVSGAQVIGSYHVPGSDSYETSARVLDLLQQHQPDTTDIKVDVVGLGVGVYDVLSHIVDDRSLNYMVTPVNFSKIAHDPEKYRNQRCEAYGMIAERFRLGQIGGNIVDDIVADLSGIKYKYDGKHTQPVIEPKEDFRARLGHSPDYGDSLVLAYYNPPFEGDVVMGALAFGYATQKWGKI
jgi:phage terminase large subunit